MNFFKLNIMKTKLDLLGLKTVERSSILYLLIRNYHNPIDKIIDGLKNSIQDKNRSMLSICI